MIVIRRGDAMDIPFMRSMLAYAYNWHTNALDTADIPLSRYVDGWGRPGDTALIAMQGGHPVGAGWFRVFRESAPGFAFVDDKTPELTIAVVSSRQGEGIGQQLLKGLVDRAELDAYRGISVSVEPGSPEVEVYEESGFERLGEHHEGITFRRSFTQL